MQILNFFLYDLVGVIGYIYFDNFAQVRFTWNGKKQVAMLEKINFWSNGQRIDADEEFHNYIQPGMEVLFSCKRVDPGTESPYSWEVCTCRLLRPLPFTRSVRITGIPGRVSSVNGKEGTVVFRDERNVEVQAYFVASVVKVDEQALDPSSNLDNVLEVGDKIFLDAIPCVCSENPANAGNVAVKVVKGEKPGIFASGPLPSGLAMFARSFIIQEMHSLFRGKRTIYVRGRGRILRMLNSHLGLIQGETSLGDDRLIAFHQASSALYETCLPATVKETNFQPADCVTFVAARTSFPSVLEWVAVQVAPYDAVAHGPLPPYENIEIKQATEEFLQFVAK